jgi:hypothetical protein
MNGSFRISVPMPADLLTESITEGGSGRPGTACSECTWIVYKANVDESVDGWKQYVWTGILAYEATSISPLNSPYLIT